MRRSVPTTASPSPKSRVHVPDGPFLVATVKAEYIGKGWRPLADLDTDFSVESQNVGESSCRIDLGDLDASDCHTMAPGDVETNAACIDLPKTDLDAQASLFRSVLDASTVFWSRRAITNRLVH